MAIDGKEQVIDTYIAHKNENSILDFFGINKMLGIDKTIKQYLNGEVKSDIKSTNNIWDFLKNNIMINFFLRDKKDELDKLKEYLETNKDNKTELDNLANEIKKWTEIESALKKPGLTTIANRDVIDNRTITPEIQAIKNSIEIKWQFAHIKEVKNKDGKVILECSKETETPYINIDVLEDLLWLALDFYKKTWDPLTINSAYRTIENQKKQKAAKWEIAAEPWESWHNLWLSIDIAWWDRYNKNMGWINGIRELAKNYNFYPLSTEDWHFDHKTLPDAGKRLAQAQSLDKDFQERNLA